MDNQSSNSAQQRQHTKKQHWIPKFYLNEFVDLSIKDAKKQFWVYNTLSALRKHAYSPLLRSAKSFAQGEYIYELPKNSLNTVEKILSSYENKFANIFQKRVKNQQGLTEKDKKEMSLFLNTLEIRHISNTLSPTFSIELSVYIEQLNQYYPADYQFLIIDKHQNHSFITGGRPIHSYNMAEANNPYGQSVYSPTLETVVPLSPKIALFINRANCVGYKTVRSDFIDEINYRVICSNLNGFFISSRKLQYQNILKMVRRNVQSLILQDKKESLMEDFLKRNKL